MFRVDLRGSDILLSEMKEELVMQASHLLEGDSLPRPLSFDSKIAAQLTLRAELPRLPTCTSSKSPILINGLLASLCLSLNSSCDETSRTQASLSP